MWVGIVVMFVGCLVVAEVGRRAAEGALGRNHLVGIRTTATLESDEAWAHAHDVAGSWLLWSGVTSAALTLVVAGLAIVGVNEDGVGIAIVVVAGWLAVGVIVAGVRGDRAARAVLHEPVD